MDKLRELLALLTVYENNFRTLHWRLIGPGFHVDHERFGDYYNTLGDFMDQTAEQIISLGGDPVTLQEALAIIDSSDVEAVIMSSTSDYVVNVADTAAYNMFNLLYKKTSEIIKDDDYQVEVVDVFTDHARYYRIEALYKLGQRLKSSTHE